MKNFLKRISLSLVLLYLPFSSFAADLDQLYQVEIIIFSHITEDGLRSEYWPVPPTLEISSRAVVLPEDQMLPASAWNLKSAGQLLRKDNNTVLLHMAWQESAADAREGHIIRIAGGDTYADDLHQVDGTVAIRLERYFSVHFNLRFTLPWETIKGLNLQNIARENDNPYTAFKFNEYLRMRSNEINYLDHPLYGVLIKIIPLSRAAQSASSH